MNTYVLFNGLSGNGTGETKAQGVKRFCTGKELIFRDITKMESYTDFFASLQQDDEMILCGGDGTLNRFINDTDGIGCTQKLFYFAAGSGNDFLRDMRGETEQTALVELNDVIRNLPRVTVKGKTYRVLNGVGYGIDGYCCEVGDALRAKSDKPINYAGFAVKGLLFHYKPTNARVTVDGEKFEFKKVWLAPTMNGRFYGGGMIPTPDQKRTDDTLSVMVMYGSGKLRTLMVVPSIFQGEHVKHDKMVFVKKGTHITVAFDRPVALQVDGETILNVSEYSIEKG